MKAVLLRLPDALATDVKSLAHEHGESVNQLIGEVLAREVLAFLAAHYAALEADHAHE